MRINRILGMLALVLAGMQVVVIFMSWLVNAVASDFPVRSLLSSEGIRWFYGTFVSNIESPVLVWMLLLSIAYGVFQRSGIACDCKVNGNEADYTTARLPYRFQRRHALRMVFAELAIMLTVIFLLAAMPHATLLNVTGSLFPSSFSQSIIPVIAFIGVICSLTYGVVCGTLRNIEEIYQSLTAGLYRLDKIIPIYILAMELYHSFLFVLSSE